MLNGVALVAVLFNSPPVTLLSEWDETSGVFIGGPFIEVSVV